MTQHQLYFKETIPSPWYAWGNEGKYICDKNHDVICEVYENEVEGRMQRNSKLIVKYHNNHAELVELAELIAALNLNHGLEPIAIDYLIYKSRDLLEKLNNE